jgi:phosphoglycolate phosphatase-like HAD superfamily hydrolase
VTLVLFWDIDGTLLTTARAGIAAWEDATLAVAGTKVDLSAFSTAGLTDIEIAGKILARCEASPGSARVSELVRRYETFLPDRLPLRVGAVLPGVRDLLDRLRERRDIVSWLLTGNTEAGARAKLRHYGLEGYFDRGAFADGCPDRPAIARRAADLVREATGQAPPTMYVIGDTPHDIHCAKTIGARAIAVASGVYAVDELRRHDPWWVLEALPAPDAFLQRVASEAA